MKLKRDSKFVEESTSRFKIGIRNFIKFDPSARKSQKFSFLMDSFWAKYKLFELKKYRGVIFHENEEGLQNLERSWLVVSKLAEGIWQILSWVLKSCKDFHFNGLLLSKVYIVWAKKVQRNSLSWNWKGIQNLERNRLVISKVT